MTTLEALDLPAWVERAPAEQKLFRQAVHIILSAISKSTGLRSQMIMKGGLLMAVRYDSGRYTRDIDFSTRQKYTQGIEKDLQSELAEQLVVANELYEYDVMCRIQRAEIRPAKKEAQFQTLSLNIGYAQKSRASDMARLANGQSTTIVQIDYSYNEAVYDVEIMRLSDGEQLEVYSLLNLAAEKLRSLLQQPIRNRYRRQDIYDLNLLIASEMNITDAEKSQLLGLFIRSCQERGIEPTKFSLAAPEIQDMAKKGFQELASEIEGSLPDFDAAYSTVQGFYELLPWDSHKADE